MSDQLIVEREGLEKKDKGELQAIVSALGGTTTARMRKADLIDQILDLSGATTRAAEAAAADPMSTDTAADTDEDTKSDPSESADPPTDAATSDASIEDQEADTPDDESDTLDHDADAPDGKADASKGNADASEGKADASDDKAKDGSGSKTGTRGDGASDATDHPTGPDGEPLADWEIKVLEEGGQLDRSSSKRTQRGGGRGRRSSQAERKDTANGSSAESDSGGGRSQKSDKNGPEQKADKNGEKGESQGAEDDVDPNNRRSRRRGRGRGRDRDDAGNAPISSEPLEVSGYLDLRDEGYAFLRVNGALPSRDDAYVSVKQVRQYGLRKGDHLTGLSRPANRNEKNPALQQLESLNGRPPEESKGRPRFDRLTPLFPDERLVLETKDEPLNMTARIVDLVAPIGKGQRGLIVSPPKAGKTSIMKTIARAVETNNPEVELIVLLVDERPEEVTDMRRHLSNGEVVASTFDRPPEEHTAVAELTIERAKRLVEAGRDVCLIVDGITRLARAYNMSAAPSGRVLSGGVDAAALYPPKRFLGAARNLEEGGSLTVLATALVETGSKMDEVIFEEFKGTGNMELRLDRRLAERRIFPAIDIDGSSTRNEELLRSRKDVEASWKLRKVIAGMNDEGGSAAAGIEMLVERLATFKTNDEFLSEISKAR